MDAFPTIHRSDVFRTLTYRVRYLRRGAEIFHILSVSRQPIFTRCHFFAIVADLGSLCMACAQQPPISNFADSLAERQVAGSLHLNDSHRFDRCVDLASFVTKAASYLIFTLDEVGNQAEGRRFWKPNKHSAWHYSFAIWPWQLAIRMNHPDHTRATARKPQKPAKYL